MEVTTEHACVSENAVSTHCSLVSQVSSIRVPLLLDVALAIVVELELLHSLQGRIFIEPTLPELSPDERAAAYRQLATTLAALHSVKPAEVGLQRYGRPSGYCARQVSFIISSLVGIGSVSKPEQHDRRHAVLLLLLTAL